MSKNGWQFIEPARRHGGTFVRACIQFDERFGEIPITDLRRWLEQMTFLDEPSDPEWQDNPNPIPRGREFDFQLWDDTGTIWFLGSYDGIAELRSRSATPEAWLQEVRHNPFAKGLREISHERALHIINEEYREPNYFDKRPGESLVQFAERMFELIQHAKFRVESYAGSMKDIDDMIDELQEIVDGDGKSLSVRRVRAALDFARKYFPQLDIPEYPSDVDIIEGALWLIHEHENRVTAETITTIDVSRRPALKAELDRAKENEDE